MHALLLALSLAAPPPPLSAPDAVADRGAVRTGPPLVHAFAVTNASGAPVHLLGVGTPCGCIAPALSREELRPGESATVTLALNTLTPAAGRQTWRGAVRYAAHRPGEAPALGQLAWALSAELVREVALTPPALALTAAGGAPVSVGVVLTDSRARPLAVKGVACTSPHLSVAVGVAADSPAGRRVALTVTAAPGLPEGEFAEAVVIHTDDPACPELRLPVALSKRPKAAAVASPASADLVVEAGRESASVLVQVRSPAGRALKLASAASDDPRVAVSAAASGRLVTLRVTATPGTEPAGRAAVTVTLTDPPGAVVVPVSWSRR